MLLQSTQVALLSLLLVGCAAEHTVTGRVVDIRGRPVRGAFVSVSELPPDWIERQPIGSSQRFVMGPAEWDGSFSMSSSRPIKYIEATSHDGKKRGVLSHVTPTNNVVVIR